MKALEIVKLENSSKPENYHQYKQILSTLAWNNIDSAPWTAEFPYIPGVRFQVAYNNQHIIIHYQVQEEFIKAQFIRPNENVWEDSCVEFFISFDDRKTYYNIEFNALGTGLIGYGTSEKTTRQRLSDQDILKVNTYSAAQTINGEKNWQIILEIPFDVLGTQISELLGKTVNANFYKCGDGLPNPHFVAWNTIENPTPNFHLPEFFGSVKFV